MPQQIIITMKGVSLPINVIVIIAIAVLVLVVLAGFFGGYFGGAATGIQLDGAIEDACQKARTVYNCAYPTALDSAEVRYKDIGESEPTGHSLRYLCNRRGTSTSGTHTSAATINECLNRCNCPLLP